MSLKQPTGSHRVWRTRLGRALAIAICLAALMTAWSALLKHNVARADRLFAQIPSENWPQLALGADLMQYRGYYWQFPASVSNISVPPYRVFMKYHIRPLYGPISASLKLLLHEIAGISYPASMYFILSLYAAAATMLMYFLLRRVGLPAVEAVLLTTACNSSFAWLSIFSVPESYSLSVCAVLLTMISGSRLPELGTPGAWRAVLRHATVAGVLGWVYPPVCGAVLLVIGQVRHRKELLRAVLPAVLLVVAIAIAPQLLRDEGGVQGQLNYGAKWASWDHFTQGRLIAEVGTAFLFLGLIAPVADFVSAKPRVELEYVVGTWTTVMAMAVILACYLTLAMVTLAHRNVNRLNGALVWFFALFLFHVYFNPKEVLLYLSVPVAVLFYVAGVALAPWYEQHGAAFNSGRKTIVSLIGALVVLLIMINFRPVVGI